MATESIRTKAMNRPIPSPTQMSVGRRGSHGQSLVEFALVVPILLVLFLAVADFGRVFAASIAVEAATRDAAEATANQYLVHGFASRAT